MFQLMKWANQANEITDDYLRGMIDWLMDWPAGLKLNGHLVRFIGQMFLCLLNIWGVIFGYARLALWIAPIAVPMAFYNSGPIGAIRMAFRFVDLSMAHLVCFYFLSCRLYHAQLRILISLFHLFRGKRWNVLRQRLDSAIYSLDQLLLGTVMFCVVVFCLPTTMVYYLLFLALRMVVVWPRQLILLLFGEEISVRRELRSLFLGHYIA